MRNEKFNVVCNGMNFSCSRVGQVAVTWYPEHPIDDLVLKIDPYDV